MKRRFFGRIKYRFGDLFATWFLSVSAIFSGYLRGNTVVSLARFLGSVAFYSMRRYRKRIEENLSLAFRGKMDIREMIALEREIFFHLALTPLETIYGIGKLMQSGVPFFEIEIRGKEYLDQALSRGHGVIAIGAHFGSFTLLASILAMAGYRMNLVINESNFPIFWRKLAFYQSWLGQRTIAPKPVTTSVKKSLNCLARNEVLYIVADEARRRGGIAVPFFGRSAYTPAGPAILSIRTGAPLVPMFVLRETESKRTLLIGNPIVIQRPTSLRTDMERLTSLFTAEIEGIIRRYPAQWAWINRRWKS